MQPCVIPSAGETAALGELRERTPARGAALTIAVERTASEVESAELR
jgi:hypothetical protein